MYKCQDCGKSTEPRQQQMMVTTKERTVEYHSAGNVTIGREIVEQKKYCQDCVYGVIQLVPGIKRVMVKSYAPVFSERR